MIAEEGAGILLYQQQEGRGIGLMAKLQAYELQDQGLDTIEANEKLGFDADYRQYTLPAEMLKQLGVNAVRLISNNPDKVAALENAGIQVTERVSAEVEPYEHAEKYLQTKKDRMGHLFSSLLNRSSRKNRPKFCDKSLIYLTAGRICLGGMFPCN